MTRDTIRAFIALDLPDSVRRTLRRLQTALREAGLRARWVRPENSHLTVRFLGDVPPSAVSVITVVLEQVPSAHTAAALTVRQLGVFPSLRRPRVIWAGLGGEVGKLREIKEAVDSGLAVADRTLFPVETRPFRAHLTLGRFKGRVDPERLGRALRTHAGFAPAAFTADRLVLYRSELTPRGAVYTALGRWMLPQSRPGGNQTATGNRET